MSTIIREILGYLLLTAGLWKFFDKCGICRKWAFVPLIRIYKVAEYADMDEDGMTWLIVAVISRVCTISSHIIEQGSTSHVRTILLLSVASMVAVMIGLIYAFRFYAELGKIFGQRKKKSVIWILLWMLYPWIPALIWGFSSRFQPEKETSAAESITAKQSGMTVKVLPEGLTINLEERAIRTRFKKRLLLKDIHMNITPGKMVLLLGGSGAGKTTFLNAVTGYEKADAKIVLDGEDVYKSFNRMKYKIGFVPQQDLIRYEDTVQKTLMDAASLRLPTECSHAEKVQRVKEVLNLFGLTPVKDNIVAKQSGGQKKRISIAMEFISNPSLFILDEPDSGLDGILARELMQHLHDISREGKIVIVITHTPDRVIDLFDEVIVLGKDAQRTGRLVFHGSIQEAREFFEVENMEAIIRKINCVDEGGEGLADSLIEKFTEVRNAEE